MAKTAVTSTEHRRIKDVLNLLDFFLVRRFQSTNVQPEMSKVMRLIFVILFIEIVQIYLSIVSITKIERERKKSNSLWLHKEVNAKNAIQMVQQRIRT